MAGFGDQDFALQLRDIVNAMVEERINELRPLPRYGIVQSVSVATHKVSVIYNGDSIAVSVNMGTLQPRIGQYVRVEGVAPDKYVTDIIGGGQSTDDDVMSLMGAW